MSKFIKILIIYVAIIGVSYLLTLSYFRIDLTSEGRFTLSDFTIESLEALTDPVYVKVYLDGDDLPMNFKNLRQAIQEQLDEFEVHAGGGLQYQFINPTESDDKEIRFGIYKELMEKGVVPIETNSTNEAGTATQKLVFPAAVLSYQGKETGINFLKSDPRFRRESDENINNSIQSTEYELINAIEKLKKSKKPEIVFINGHGELDDYDVMKAEEILSEYYEVKFGAIQGRIGVLDQFSAVIVAKPQQPFSEQDKFVLDQYIMKGGSVLWLTEGAAVSMDSLKMSAQTFGVGRELNLLPMLFSYGARVNYNLIQDKQSSFIGLPQDVGNGKVEIKPYQWTYFPLILSDNSHPVNKYLDVIKTEFVSSIDTVGENPNVHKTILLRTSPESKTEQVPVDIRLEMVRTMPTDKNLNKGPQNIAVLLEGTFESAYKHASVSEYFPGFPKDSIITTSKHAKQIVVSDGDLIKNAFDKNGKPKPLGYDEFSRRIFEGNGQFILNAVNYLCNDGELPAIRARELKMRLLDKESVKKDRLKIQIVNTVLPVSILIVFGLIVGILRRKKYSK